MLGFKAFWSAQKLIAGIEIMQMVKEGQLHCLNGHPMSAAAQFYSLTSRFLTSNANKLTPTPSSRQNPLAKGNDVVNG